MTLADRIETKLAKRGLADQILHEAQLENLCPGQYERFVKIAAEVRKLEATVGQRGIAQSGHSIRIENFQVERQPGAVEEIEDAG